MSLNSHCCCCAANGSSAHRWIQFRLNNLQQVTTPVSRTIFSYCLFIIMNQKTQTLQQILVHFLSQDFSYGPPMIFIYGCSLLVHSVNASEYHVKLQDAEWADRGLIWGTTIGRYWKKSRGILFMVTGHGLWIEAKTSEIRNIYADGGTCLQIWRVATNIPTKQSKTIDKG